MSRPTQCDSALLAEDLVDALPGIRILAGECSPDGLVLIWFTLPGDASDTQLLWRSSAPGCVEVPEHSIAGWLAFEASILNEADRDPGDEHRPPCARDFEVWVAGPAGMTDERRVGVWSGAGRAAIAAQLESAGYDPAVCRYEELVNG